MFLQCCACQFAFFHFCVGNFHEIVAHVQVKAMKVMPELWIAQGYIAKVALPIELSPKWGKNCMLHYGVERVSMEPVKTVL